MTKLLPECAKCSSPVTNSLETEIELHGKIKTGHYINGVWICDDCIKNQEEENARKEKEEKSSYSTDHSETIGPASKADVSPNTPRADEEGL